MEWQNIVAAKCSVSTDCGELQAGRGNSSSKTGTSRTDPVNEYLKAKEIWFTLKMNWILLKRKSEKEMCCFYQEEMEMPVLDMPYKKNWWRFSPTSALCILFCKKKKKQTRVIYVRRMMIRIIFDISNKVLVICLEVSPWPGSYNTRRNTILKDVLSKNDKCSLFPVPQLELRS